MSLSLYFLSLSPSGSSRHAVYLFIPCCDVSVSVLSLCLCLSLHISVCLFVSVFLSNSIGEASICGK